MSKTDISALTDVQLVHHELGLQRTMFGHQLRHRMNQLENNSVLKTTRREIARAQTALRARELAAGADRGSLRQAHASTFVPAALGSTDAGSGFLKGLLDKPEAAE